MRYGTYSCPIADSRRPDRLRTQPPNFVTHQTYLAKSKTLNQLSRSDETSVLNLWPERSPLGVGRKEDEENATIPVAAALGGARKLSPAAPIQHV